MEKVYLSAERVVKNLRNESKMARVLSFPSRVLWARVPITVSSCSGM